MASDSNAKFSAAERAAMKERARELKGQQTRAANEALVLEKIAAMAPADKVLAELGVQDPLLDIAKELEAAALADSYFIERKLYPNVDFYTGVIYKALGFPPRMFTALFALGRLPGWIAHWREMNMDAATKIGRPQQIYIGEEERSLKGFFN